jgi:hypothetical protein
MPGAATPNPRGFSDLVNLGVAQVFLDTYWENRVIDNVLLEHIKKFGHITFSKSLGKFAEWTARVAKYASGYRGRGVRRNFEAKQLRVAYAAAYSRLESTAVFYEEDIEDMDDKNAKRWLDRELTDMSVDFMIDLNERLLAKHTQDSNTLYGVAQDPDLAAGDPGLIGLIDMFSYGAAAIQYIPGTTAGTNGMSSSIIEVLPNGTYCGVSTHPDAAIAGVNGQRIVGATSPVIINADTTNTNIATVSSGTVGWANNATRLLDYAIVRCRRGNKASERPTLAIVTPSDLLSLKTLIGETITRDVTISEKEHTELNSGLIAREFVPYGSLRVVEDSDCPSNVRYILHPSQFEFVAKPATLLATGRQLIKGKTDAWFKVEQQYDIDEGGQKLVGSMKAQCWANPFKQGIITDFSVI